MEKFCSLPFRRIQIMPAGTVYTCCPGWLPKPIGNIFQQGLPEIWGSEDANEIRKTMINGTFTFCQEKKCAQIASGDIYSPHETRRRNALLTHEPGILDKGPEIISLNYDYSCNLYCRSCRDEIKVLAGEQEEKILEFQRVFLHSDYFKEVRRLIITGAGEPFVSHVFMDLFKHIRRTRNPELKIRLRTNGLLLTSQTWEQLENIHYAIDEIWISIDAATEKTYQMLRRGGNFHTLLNNLAFLKGLKRKISLRILLSFVVQQANYGEMEAFVQLAKAFHCDKVAFSQMYNWRTYSPDEYYDAAIHEPGHPEFMQLKTIVNQPVFQEPLVSLGNLSHLLDK